MGTSDTGQIGVLSTYLTSTTHAERTFAIHAHSVRGPLNKTGVSVLDVTPGNDCFGQLLQHGNSIVPGQTCIGNTLSTD